VFLFSGKSIERTPLDVKEELAESLFRMVSLERHNKLPRRKQRGILKALNAPRGWELYPE
jgi:hypothetical protein